VRMPILHSWGNHKIQHGDRPSDDPQKNAVHVFPREHLYIRKELSVVPV
jgi:hypothetical protein